LRSTALAPGRTAGSGPARVAIALAALVLALGTGASEPPAPLPFQEPGGLQRLFLQFPFEAPSVAAPGAFEGEVRLLYSNTILLASGPAASVDVDLETAQFTGFLRVGIATNVEVQVAVPFTVDYGGFLDPVIEAVEGLFHAANPARQGRPNGLTRFRVTYLGQSAWVDGSDAGLGDVWFGVKGLVLEPLGARPAIALRGAVKLPTGRYPFGSGEPDVGASLLVGWSVGRLAARVEVDGATATAALRAAGIGTRPYGALDLGLTYSATDALALHLQGSASTSPLRGTGLDEMDAGVRYLLLGLSARVSPTWELEFAMVENVFSPFRGADFTLLLGGRGRL